ncbi:MAG: UDP-glucose 4-epimerase GalE [Acidobacteriota bacterium]|nr:UDP-glucose 4-epimerase GalE [Acidobacteriota bacterium]
MTVLVVGGAGYIGSHTVKLLGREGFRAIVFDNFSSGRRELARGREVITGDLADKASLRAVFEDYQIDSVLHFASLIQVGESYRDPRKYYVQNLVNSLNLLEAMLDADVKNLIFSSSAAVYGIPQEVPIHEGHPLNPCNPYGKTKFMVEKILQDYARAYGLRFISLRYFNASGADPEGELGEMHDPETHLIPNILLTIAGKRPQLDIYGTDFPTPDGTAVRDYIHVTDLAAAHVLALRGLLAGQPSNFINLGANRGFSVLEIIRKAEEVTGRTVPCRTRPRREGDVPVLLASKERAEQLLGWKIFHSEIENIIETAWRWHQKSI